MFFAIGEWCKQAAYLLGYDQSRVGQRSTTHLLLTLIKNHFSDYKHIKSYIYHKMFPSPYQ